MAIINANFIQIAFADDNLADRLVIRHLTNVSMDFADNLVEVTRMDTNGWRELVNGVKSVNMSFDAILDADQHYDDIDTAIEGATMEVYFGDIGFRRTGTGFLQNVSVSGGVDDAPTISASIEITGEVVEEIINASDILLDQNFDPITDNDDEVIITLIRR